MYERGSRFALVVVFCVFPFGALTSCDDETTEAECREWSGHASTARRDAQDAAGRACGSDEDCVLVDYGLDCFADCGYPSAVARDGVPALEAEVQSIDERFCGAFEEHGCPRPIIPPCDAPPGTPVARCQSGQCTLEWMEYR